MTSIAALVASGRILVSDGAWGTFLQAKGLKPGDCPESWNLGQPDAVRAIAEAYLQAGADVVETNSFGGNRIKLQRYGLADRAYDINREAARLSRQAAGSGHLVFGSVGPTGKLLLMGEVTTDEMYECFREQARALEEGGADAILIETMTDLEEAKLAIWAARENTGLEVGCTMTFDRTVSGEYRTIMGVSPAEMVHELVDAGAHMLGTNCGNGMSDMIPIVREIRREHATVPVIVHANAGVPVYRDGATVFPESAEEMAGKVVELIEAGANIIGGCCGTTPEHIRRIAEVVHGLKVRH